MENQHRKIKGYRELSQSEVDLMNEIKAQGEVLGHLLSKVCSLREHNRQQTHKALASDLEPELTHHQLGDSCTAHGLAEDHLKTGIMWLVRSVALPTTF